MRIYLYGFVVLLSAVLLVFRVINLIEWEEHQDKMAQKEKAEKAVEEAATARRLEAYWQLVQPYIAGTLDSECQREDETGASAGAPVRAAVGMAADGTLSAPGFAPARLRQAWRIAIARDKVAERFQTSASLSMQYSNGLESDGLEYRRTVADENRLMTTVSEKGTILGCTSLAPAALAGTPLYQVAAAQLEAAEQELYCVDDTNFGVEGPMKFSLVKGVARLDDLSLDLSQARSEQLILGEQGETLSYAFSPAEKTRIEIEFRETGKVAKLRFTTDRMTDQRCERLGPLGPAGILRPRDYMGYGGAH